MNTSKQVNIMIGVVLLSILIFGGYMLNEASRQADAREQRTEEVAERGARLFVNNCRTCHGLEGEGGVGPPLDIPAFRILDKDNPYGVEATAQGEADSVRKFLHETIACGRTGTFMPIWGQEFGGPLSETQINQLVTMITEGRWDLVRELGAEHDAEAGTTAADIFPQDPSALAVTEKNCGQYTPDTAADIHGRDPFSAGSGGAAPTGTPEATTTAAPSGDGGNGGAAEGAIGVTLSEFDVEPAESSATAGEVTFSVVNDGAIAHELVVVKSDAAEDALPVQGGVVPEDQVDVIDKTGQIRTKQSEDLTVTLEAGSYILICNIPAHYGSGMHAAFTVQ